MIVSRIRIGVSRILTYLKYELCLNKSTKLNQETALSIINRYNSQEYPIFCQNNTIMPTVDLHIIVPVYNVKQYLDECISSLLNQITEYTYTIVAVNDGSTDGSERILQKYENHPSIKILQQNNGGVSRARNKALIQLCGKYIMFVDSDDILPENAVQVLLSTAYNYNAEIVEGGYRNFDSNGYRDSCCHSDKIQKWNSNELFGYPWGKVIRSDKLEKFCFPEGFLFEDTVMRTLLYPTCEVTYVVPDIVYYYRDNHSGITRSSDNSQRSIDSFWMMKYCLEERVRRGQQMGTRDLEDYLYACYRNWGRTRNLPIDVQESIFVISCNLIFKYFGCYFNTYDGKYYRLLRAIERRSFSAFLLTVRNWRIM